MSTASEASSEFVFLEAQLRQVFGRVVYTHKTHLKMADKFAYHQWLLKLSSIVLSSLTASGAVGVLLVDSHFLKIGTCAVAVVAAFLSLYCRGFDPGAAAQKHRETAAGLWTIRESYLSLLTDIVAGILSVSDIRKKRDDLQKELSSIYRNAPQTDGQAYHEAQVALKENEEYTFSDQEIDAFLPRELHWRSRAFVARSS